MINKTEIEKIKEEYVEGMRIRLLKMDDVQSPAIGTEGTVRGVDDIGSILVAWDNGSHLSVAIDEDEIEIVTEEKTYTVYSKEADMTFIMEDKDKTISVKGFYFGEPDADATIRFYGALEAIID